MRHAHSGSDDESEIDQPDDNGLDLLLGYADSKEEQNVLKAARAHVSHDDDDCNNPDPLRGQEEAAVSRSCGQITPAMGAVCMDLIAKQIPDNNLSDPFQQFENYPSHEHVDAERQTVSLQPAPQRPAGSGLFAAAATIMQQNQSNDRSDVLTKQQSDGMQSGVSLRSEPQVDRKNAFGVYESHLEQLRRTDPFAKIARLPQTHLDEEQTHRARKVRTTRTFTRLEVHEC